MNSKTTSFASIAVAVTLAAAPASAALAAESSSAAAAPAASAVATTASSVVKNISAATGAASTAALATQAGPAAIAAQQAVAPFVVLTKDAVQSVVGGSSPLGLATEAASSLLAGNAATVELPDVAEVLSAVPEAVETALNIAGLPVAGVWNVVKVSQGVYTVFYNLLSTVPSALITGNWGKVPTLLADAATSAFTWITTGAAPKADDAAATTTTAAKAVSSSASSVLSVADISISDVITSALDVAAIPVKALWSGVKTAQEVYSNFYGLLTSVPNALITGKWGSIPGLIGSAFTNSISAVVNLPLDIVKDAGKSVSNLAESLAPSAPAVEDTKVGAEKSGAVDSVTGESKTVSVADVADLGATSVATKASAQDATAKAFATGTGAADADNGGAEADSGSSSSSSTDVSSVGSSDSSSSDSGSSSSASE